MFFLRLIGHNFEKNIQGFNKLFIHLIRLSNEGLANLPLILEKHRIFAEFYHNFYPNDLKLQFEKSVISDAEFFPVMTLYAKEILKDESAYKQGIKSLIYLLKNFNNFMTKKNYPKATDGVT